MDEGKVRAAAKENPSEVRTLEPAGGAEAATAMRIAGTESPNATNAGQPDI